MSNQNSLENIYRMITPANLIAAQKVSSSKTESTIGSLLNILYGTGNKGVNSIDELRKKLTELLSGTANDDELKAVKKILKFYSTGPSIGIDKLSASSMIYSDNGTSKTITSMKELLNSTSDLKKGFAYILSNTPFINPSIRNAEKAEIFLNYIPSLFASRMVPYFEAEFEYAQEGLDISQRSSQIKFLLGNDSSAIDTEVNKKMINAISRRIEIPEKGNKSNDKKEANRVAYSKYAGMEMFTSPQTLVNPDSAQFNKYTQVLDPFRPFASIESFDISVESTVGLFSYKKGTMVIKIHDKSRLTELSEFIQPQLNKNSSLRVKYGWIYPYDSSEQNNDGSSTYGDFINNNFIIDEIYSVINSSFSFDANGQVTITLQIAMRSANELRNIKHSADPDSSLQSLKDLEEIGKSVTRLLQDLQIDSSSGVLKEIRGYQIIDAAQNGSFPEDLSVEETKKLLEQLKQSLKKNEINPSAASKLAEILDSLYSVSPSSTTTKKEASFSKLDQVKNEALQKVQKRFNDVAIGPDPFLVSTESHIKFKEEAGVSSDHPYLELIAKYNQEISDSKNQKQGAQTSVRFKKKLISFGKLFSVFAGQSLQSLNGVDEFQVYFYSFNEKAGRASSTNIAEFPIELNIFLEHYREHVERYGTTDITLENFLMLVRDSQLHDTRALAYGFRDYFDPFEPGKEASLKEARKDEFENEISGFSGKYGAFNKPVIEFYAETISKNTQDAEDKSNQTILRLHIFDKNMTPYKTASSILRSDKSEHAEFFEVNNSYSKEFSSAVNSESNEQSNSLIRELITKNDDGSVKIALNKGFSNYDIKKTITRTVPTIIIGANASMVKSADLASNADALLSTIQMQNQNKGIRPANARPNGSGASGLPLRVIPASLNLVTMGCPLLTFSQQFFIDFATGTTLDNIYVITGLKHSISPGRFESTATMTFYDAYGKFEGAPVVIDYVKKQLQLIAGQSPPTT